MGDKMEFPDNPMQFVEEYSFKDKDGIYTNGSDLIPVFRVKQMLEHYHIPYVENHNPQHERLTCDYVDDMQYIIRHCVRSDNIDLNCGGDDFQDIVDKLAGYEILEEVGRLKRIPIHVGGFIYVDTKLVPLRDFPDCDGISTWVVDSVQITCGKNSDFIEFTAHPYMDVEHSYYWTFNLDDVGYNVFFTKEAALAYVGG